MTGSKASHVNAVHSMHQACNKSKASLLKIDDVGDVLTETVSQVRFGYFRVRLCFQYFVCFYVLFLFAI